MMAIGITNLEIATTHHVVDLVDLAEARGVDPDKYRIGLGQDAFSFPAPDEDIVTMGATAAEALLERTGRDGIRTLFFATESGVDQSKSAAVFTHGLLGLAADVRAVELKQACYGATAALQAAFGIVARNPSERVLVIAADVARYELRSAGEPTQGAGAVAMLVSADPQLLEFDAVSGIHTADVDDFWRPNDSTTALVDGKLSMSAYIDATLGAWDDLVRQGGSTDFAGLAYHQPFTKMAAKAQKRLNAHAGTFFDDALITEMSLLNRRMGNSYTASTYIALASLLSERDLVGQRVGVFSYGSGSVSELLPATVVGSDDARSARVAKVLDSRASLPVAEYERLHAVTLPSAVDVATPRVTSAPFRFAGIRSGARQYERTA